MLRTAVGDLLTLTASGRGMVGDAGERIGAVVALTDVTADRERLRQLQAAHAELADREERLLAAVTELRRSNDELEGFAAAASHDLVRPLASASGYLELLAELYSDRLDERAAKWLEGASRSMDRMQQLVRALLSYAQAGQAPCRAVPVDLTEVVALTTADLAAAIGSTGAEVSVRGTLPEPVGDPTLLRQLLQNLVDNAIKYRHPDRPPRVVIAGETGPEQWVITVSDNGMGIPAEERDRVFDMFSQVDPAARKGYGIGLSPCLRIVERHRGTITIGEAEGGGTVFRLHLPRER